MDKFRLEINPNVPKIAITYNNIDAKEAIRLYVMHQSTDDMYLYKNGKLVKENLYDYECESFIDFDLENETHYFHTPL